MTNLISRPSTLPVPEVERVVRDVGTAVPRLGVGWVDGGEAGGVGVHPAAELRGVLAKASVGKVGFGVALVD